MLDAYADRKMQLSPVAWPQDGSRVYVYSGGEDVNPADMGLYTVRASDGGDLSRVLVTPPAYNDYVAVSPDGLRVLVLRSTTNLDGTLFGVNIGGTGRHQLTPPQIVSTVTGAISVQSSPDGKQLAFTSESGPDDQIALIHPDGTGLTRLTDGTDGSITAPVWSPDATKLLFQRKLNGRVTLWTMNADGTSQAQLTPTLVAADFVGGCASAPFPGR